ncbi:methyltransferase domain-containing protein [Leifsonia sp. ZF2019]|uniref:class I SAM-dependent methyltransferase n=1 Tax=Leifsonia sp. ZF2019 TaxID=2781978 RepID=UPI001CBDEB83|nr:methyltransferase domain-containing protein [Leifsonia sp. ZF2019]UAJ78500.1 methyltransferase domain-containing protein [Leifsonia sp. ZF2019]
MADGTPDAGTGEGTAGDEYAERLRRLDGSWWRRTLNVQAPYRWNIRRLRLGRVLDVGCGLGRNLAHLGNNGVGVDHNAASIEIARARGLTAFTSDEFPSTEYAVPGAFDSMLAAHLVEHLDADFAVSLLTDYLRYIKPGGRVCFITPQEVGYRSDATHVSFVDFDGLARLSERIGVRPERHYSFPFPRAAGKVFQYNEFVMVSRIPSA